MDKETAVRPIHLEDISPVDLVVCPSCRTVISLSGVEDVEELEGSGFVSRTRLGVFCPNCEQKLFDHRTWAKHLAERLRFDEEEGSDAEAREDIED